MKTLTFQISDEAYDLLCRMRNRALEYRDTEFRSLPEFKKSSLFKEGHRTESWFMNRNSEGTLYLIDELSYYGLVDSDGESWHLTYVLTHLGKSMLYQIENA